MKDGKEAYEECRKSPEYNEDFEKGFTSLYKRFVKTEADFKRFKTLTPEMEALPLFQSGSGAMKYANTHGVYKTLSEWEAWLEKHFKP